jgi:TPR repeat protein
MTKSTSLYLSLTFWLLWATNCCAVDIFKTDKHFSDKQYELALQGYLDATERGNPHAYYQLGNMYIKGLGVEQDIANGIMYFAVAAEYDFHTSTKILDKILSQIPQENVPIINNAIEEFVKQRDPDKIKKALFPVIIEENLDIKLIFGDGEALQTKFYGDDVDADNLSLNNVLILDDDAQAEDLANFGVALKKPLYIVDHDIHWDGSVRHYRQVQKIGSEINAANVVNELTQYPLAIPKIDGRPVEFLSRAYLGAATYNKFSLLNENPDIYHKINRYVIKLKKDTSLNAQFEYATALINFPWITQEEGDAEKILLRLSKLGHSPAMFEYGLLLYRTQRDIEQAIYWISESAKYGLTRAEYRVGKLLQSSPWVEYDPHKALYWFESAAEKGSNAAKIRAADIKLTSKNVDLIDIDKANTYLLELKDSQSRNPEYFYLLAQSMRLAKEKDFKAIFSTMRKAISMGQVSNWDVSEWQDELNIMMQGNISISEEGNCADNPELCG